MRMWEPGDPIEGGNDTGIPNIKYFDYPSDCFGKAKLYLIDICKKIESELNRKIKVLKRNKGCILMGEDYYFILLILYNLN